MNTEGFYLVWWEVTTAGKTQDMLEAVVEFRAHSQVGANAYIELEELKSTAELTGTGFADADLQVAILAASRGIDDALGRRFWQDTDANQVRYYTPKVTDTLWVDDLVTLTEVATDATGGTTFADVWTVNADFVLEPLNAAAEGKPYTHLTIHPTSSLYLPCGYPRSVRVTGKFGWPAVPSEVKTLTRLVAMRLLKRTREAPLGFVELGVDGAAVRASGYARDPEYAFLTEGLSRKVVFA